MTDLPNWFKNDGLTNFSSFLLGNDKFKNKSKFLQIGAYTGDASVWLAENILTHNDESYLVDIDTWEGSEEPVHDALNWKSVEQVYDEKTEKHRVSNKIIKHKTTSDRFFKSNSDTFDFIYIDGDHTSYGVLKDAVNAYECLNLEGIIAFDDYLWSAGLGTIKEPKPAIDAFLTIYLDRVDVIYRGYQVWCKKIR